MGTLATLESAAGSAPLPQVGSQLDSLSDLLVNGGPVMIPIGLCSVIALAYAVERWLRLRPGRLGTGGFGDELVDAVKEDGPVRGLDLCDESPTPLSRILGAGLRRWNTQHHEMEKAVEDAGSREARALVAKLRPLVVVAAIAPLLGLLGTVWGMIEAFSNIALQDGLGKPELLAGGIAQALITTATGLAIAIPTHAAYHYLRSRIDGFVHRTEDLYQRLAEVHELATVPALPAPGIGVTGAVHAHP
jgi:biopolymer transport protein ExbB